MLRKKCKSRYFFFSLLIAFIYCDVCLTILCFFIFLLRCCVKYLSVHLVFDVVMNLLFRNGNVFVFFLIILIFNNVVQVSFPYGITKFMISTLDHEQFLKKGKQVLTCVLFSSVLNKKHTKKRF